MTNINSFLTKKRRTLFIHDKEKIQQLYNRKF